MSKGSNPRPVNKEQFDENYETIDWEKNKSKDIPRLSDIQVEELIEVVKSTNFKEPQKLE